MARRVVRPSAGISLLLTHHSYVRYPLADCGQPKDELERRAGASSPPMRLPTAPAATAAVIAACAAGIIGSSQVFGILDNTGDELADYLGVDEVPAIAVSAVRLLQPAYEPLKALSPSCTEALYPEFNDVNDWNDCSLLSRRIFWRPRAPPLVIKQAMTKANMWEVSTGSAVWGSGIVLTRYMEELGQPFWQGKRVLELGTGTGFGAVTAAKVRVRLLGFGLGLGLGQFRAIDLTLTLMT